MNDFSREVSPKLSHDTIRYLTSYCPAVCHMATYNYKGGRKCSLNLDGHMTS